MKWQAFIVGVSLAAPCWAPITPARLNIKTEDGTVNTYPYQARFTNGTVTDHNDGTVSITSGGGGGGGTTGFSSIGITWDGAGTALTTGSTYWVVVPASGTITQMVVNAVPSGSVTVNISSSAVFNTGAKSICASACPALSGATAANDTTLTGWTTSVIKDQFLYFAITSVSTIQQLVITLEYTKS